MKKLSKRFLTVFIGLLAVLVILAVFGSGFFNIKKISIEGSIACAQGQQIEEVSGLLGRNFFLVDNLKTESVLKNKFICIKKADVSRYLPDKVGIKIANRQALAVLADLKNEASFSATPAAQDIKDNYLIDNEGVIFDKGSAANIPQIFAYGFDISVGSKLGKTAGNIIKILEKIKSLGLDAGESILNGDVFTVNLNPPATKIIFRLNAEVDIQLASLQLIVDKAKMDTKEPEFIDLRFDKPVVKFAPKK